jgi:hypothetical protein
MYPSNAIGLISIDSTDPLSLPIPASEIESRFTQPKHLPEGFNHFQIRPG